MTNTDPNNYQKVADYAGIELFNVLPLNIKSLHYDITVFKPTLKNCILFHSFYLAQFTSNKSA
jgi:hypothetical protein